MPDIPGDSTTTTTILVGGTLNDQLEVVGDHDWIAITLTAGQQIVISLSGSGTSPVADTYLRIRDSSGTLIGQDDDGGPGLNSQLVFTAPSNGTYYIDVGAYSDGYAGGYELSVQPYTPPPPPPLATYDEIATQLTHGYWGGGWHRFNVTQGGEITVNLTALTAEGQNLARTALAMWSDVIGVTFREVSSGGQMTFDDNDSGAYASTSWSGNIISSSHVNVSTQWLVDYGTSLNSYAFQAYVHEVGHALGLGHAGNYNSTASYPDDALFVNDSWVTSVMSYFSPTENSHFANQGFTYQFFLSPMNADIVAMQWLYGLSTTTRAGNTTYGFNSNAGRDAFNASLHPTVGYAIIDSGGIDTLDYSGFSANQRIDLNQESFSNVGGRTGNVTIARGTAIENAIGGAGHDTIIGNSENNVLTGNGGNDILQGGLGNDTASYANNFAAVTVDLAITTSQNTGGAGFDTLTSIENLIGGSGGDTLRGNALANGLEGRDGNDTLEGRGGADTLHGGDGDDLLDGGTGNDILSGGPGVDTFIGGEGIDTVSYEYSTTGVVVSLSLGSDDNDTFNGVENLVGSLHADSLTGDTGANRIWAGDGNDYLHGGAGDDILDGGAGADEIIGGTGNDYLLGRSGIDIMRGGTGDDTYRVDESEDVVRETVGAGVDTVLTTVSYALQSGIEIEFLRVYNGSSVSALNLTGNEFSQTIAGNDGSNILRGRGGDDYIIAGSGDDQLDGGTGVDILRGGLGDDTFYIDNAADDPRETAGEGYDTLITSVSFALANDQEIEVIRVADAASTYSIDLHGNEFSQTIVGSDGINTLDGREGNDTLEGRGGVDRLLGGAGNDILDGGAGIDIMRGGLGNDTYYVDHISDSVIENLGEGIDTVYSSASFSLRSNVEHLILTGSAIRGNGNNLSNQITGNDANNIINGGLGADTLSGGLGNDTYYVDNIGDTIVEAAGGGRDRVYTEINWTLGANQEDLYARGSNPLALTGNELDNVLRGNSAGNVLTGGTGADDLKGGGGADTFVFDDGDFGGLTPSTCDRIIDFTRSDGDVIDLSAVDANSALSGDQAFAFIGTGGFTNVAGQLRYEQINGNTYVYGDVDGDGVADFMLRLDGTHALNSGDFVI